MGHDTVIPLSLVKPIEVHERVLGVPVWKRPKMTVHLQHFHGAACPIVIVEQGDRATDWHIHLTTDEAKDLGVALVDLWADGSYAGYWRKEVGKEGGFPLDRYNRGIRLSEILYPAIAISLDAAIGERLAESEDGRPES